MIGRKIEVLERHRVTLSDHKKKSSVQPRPGLLQLE